MLILNVCIIVPSFLESLERSKRAERTFKVFCLAFFQKSEWVAGRRPADTAFSFRQAFSFAPSASKEKASRQIAQSIFDRRFFFAIVTLGGSCAIEAEQAAKIVCRDIPARRFFLWDQRHKEKSFAKKKCRFLGATREPQ
ncbi:MAG: hypothetical protein J6W28_06475, partial [Clostridia bacterium]|nr:hypothetical protein [Clostridia bacterium]